MDTISDTRWGQPESVSDAPPVWNSSDVSDVQKSASASSILIHEVKAVAKPGESLEKCHFREKLDRAAKHVIDSLKFIPHLASLDPKRAEKLTNCASWLLFREYLETGDVKLASGIFCQQPLLCGFCAAGRAARQVAALEERLSFILGDHLHLRPYMVTLTMRGMDDLAPMVEKFWKSWGTLIQRRRNAIKGLSSSVLQRIAGGVLIGEAKRGKAGQWHYHGHGIFLADLDRYQPTWEALKREWAGVLGQSSASVQFEPIQGDLFPAIKEVCKYASKWQPGEYSDRWEAFQALSSVRRVRAFGLCWGVKIPEEVTDDLTGLEALEYVERAFRFNDGSYVEVPTVQREPAFDEFSEFV